MSLDLKRANLFSYGQWIQPTLPGTFWCHWYEAESVPPLTLGQKMHQCVFLDGHSILFKEDIKHIQELVEKIVKPAQLKKYIKIIEETGRQFETEHLRLLKAPKEYETYLPKLFSTYLNVVGLWWFTIPASLELEKYVRKKYPNISDEELFRISKPIRATWLELHDREIKSFAKSIRAAYPRRAPEQITANLLNQNKKLWQKMRSHVEEFSWHGTHHWMGESYTMTRCLEQIRDAIKRPARATITISKKTVMSSDLVKLMRVLNYWRTHCAELTSKVVFLSKPVLMHLAKTWRISYENLTYLSHKEILANIGSTKLPKKFSKIILERKTAYGCVLDKERTEQIYTGQELKRIIGKLVETKIPKITSLLGTVASRGGIVRGRAIIVMSPKDFSNFKRGDILVANETTPDFVPLMSIAAAIVTDAGGITSHAAIVSREMNTPCIVGTKIATRIFKSGDQLEVDATKGIVRIIKSKG